MRGQSPISYDAIVVGGRLAGSGTALQLARFGRRVLVVERGRYGSDPLSTHALMRAGVMQVPRWGLLDEVRAAGTPAIRRTVVRYGGVEEVVDIKPSAEVPALYAPRRSLLDRILVDAVRCAGAETRFGTQVTGLLRDDAGRVVGVEGRDRDGRFEARGPLTIGADGPRSTVARLVGAPVTTRGRHATAFVVDWWEGLEVDGYQWPYGDGASGGVIPTNDRKSCVLVGVPWTSFPRLRAQA